MKTCLECNKELTGAQRKFCSRAHKSNWRTRNIYGSKYQRAYRARSPRNYLSQLRSYHNRKDTLSLDFLEELYYKQEGKCAITKQIMTFTQEQGRCQTNISIDRIDSSVGYLESNVQLVCHKVNTMKGEDPESDLKQWAHRILYHCDLPVVG